MNTPNRFEDLSPTAQLQIDEVCDRFEAGWLGGPRPRVETYLPSPLSAEHAALALALVALDVEYRRKHGESPTPAEYAARVPVVSPEDLAGLFSTVLSPRPPLITTQGYVSSANDVPRAGRTGAPTPGSPVPGYEVFEELGRGGMGVVYRARQVKLNRQVALKMVLGGGEPERKDLIRFLAEAEAVAAVRHPNVVQVYDYGEHDGRPYMALEYLPGGTLASRLPATKTPRESVRLVVSVARGVAAAHEVGIVHRDLKPANVLLGENGEPKVTDFGLAKRATAGDLTRTGAIMGTPAYMAPEQARGLSKFVGPRSDVWALGVILYEALAGRRPFAAESAHAVLRRVIDDEPVPPSRVAAGVPRDLEAVCLKCLEKAPAKRYGTASEVVAELDRYLAGEPVSARPAGWLGRATKWATRKPYQAATVGFAVLAVGLVVVGSVLAALWGEAASGRAAADFAQGQAEKARDDLKAANEKLDEANKEIRRRDYLSRVHIAGRAYSEGDVETARRVLDECEQKFRDRWEWKYLDRATRPLLASLKTGLAVTATSGFSQFQMPYAGDDLAQLFALSPDGQTLAFSSGREAAIYDVASGKRTAELPAWKDMFFPQTGGVEARYVFSPDGRELFVWRRGSMALPTTAPPAMKNHLTPTLAELDRLAAEVAVFKLDPGKPPTPGRAIPLPPAVLKDRGVVGIAAPPDGKTLLVAQTVKVEPQKLGEAAQLLGWKLVLTTLSRADGSVVGVRELPFGVCMVAVFSPACDRAAFACHEAETAGPQFAGGGFGGVQMIAPKVVVRVVDLKSGAETCRLVSGKSASYGPSESVNLSFDPTGTRLAVVWMWKTTAGTDLGGWSEGPTVWDAVTGEKIATLRGSTSVGLATGTGGLGPAIAFDPDGRLVTGETDGWLRVWDVDSGAVVRSYRSHARQVMAVSARGRTVASVDLNGVTRVWDRAAPPTFQPAPLSGERYHLVRVEGPTVAQGGTEPRVLRPDGTVVALEMKGKSAFPDQFSGDRKRILGLEHHQEKPSRTDYYRLTLWDAASGRVIRAFEEPGKFVGGHALSPDGSLVAALLDPGPIRIFDADSGAVRAVLELPEQERMTEVRTTGGFNQETGRGVYRNVAYTAGFSPDGRVLVTYHQDMTYRCWDVASGRLLSRVASNHAGLSLAPIEFLPDGRLVTAEGDGPLHLWDPTTGAEVPTPLRSIPGKGAGSFSRDGSLWVRAGLDGTDRMYDAASGTELLNLTALGMQECRFTPGGELIGYGKEMGLVQFDDVRAVDRFPASPLVARPGPAVQGVAVQVPVRAAGTTSKLGTLTAVVAATTGNQSIWFLRDASGMVESIDGNSGVVKWTAQAGPGRTLVGDQYGQALAAGGTDGTVSLLDPTTGKVVRKLEGKPGVVEAVAMIPGGHLIAAVVTADKESTVRLWGYTPGAAATPPTPPATLEGSPTDVRAIAVTPHFQEGEKPVVTHRLATAHADGGIRIWDAITRKEEFALKGHQGPVIALAFTRDGAQLASLGADRTVRLWDLKKRDAETITLPHPGRALVIDEPAKAVGSSDNRVRVTVLAGEGDAPVGWLWVWDRSREGSEPLTRVSGGWAAGSALAVVPLSLSGGWTGGLPPAVQVLTVQPKNGLNVWSLPGWTFKLPTPATPPGQPMKP